MAVHSRPVYPGDLDQLSIELRPMDPGDFGRFLLSEDERYRKICIEEKLGTRYN